MRRFLASLPNALSYARIGLTIATYPLALRQNRPLFAVAILLIVLTDMLDGPIARRYGRPDRAGANLDSASDFLFYASLPVWAWIMRPDAIRPYLALIAIYFVAYASANLLARARLGQLGFHNEYTRAAGTIGVGFALVTVLWGIQLLLLAGILLILTIDLAVRFKRILAGAPREPALREGHAGP